MLLVVGGDWKDEPSFVLAGCPALGAALHVAHLKSWPVMGVLSLDVTAMCRGLWISSILLLRGVLLFTTVTNCTCERGFSKYSEL